ncbi:YicC/YloC family endoribonuclease [Pelistega sp. MC2]|uniref:YicC/YloC family endoribonuclease n=1 Tax=Pelistega sp. MC2 TaxID=1720297 RepID=UPI0008DADE22|nr:YicC/YloC family endoribonuclease [Pelistega sp. MC2]
MIYSMTAFASQHSEHALGQLIVELKSVNNRFLDLHLRIPEELRASESALRELLSNRLNRGKIELRITLQKHKNLDDMQLDNEVVALCLQQLNQARQIIPDTGAPSLSELITLSQNKQLSQDDDTFEQWHQLLIKTTDDALDNFILNRAREGKRLAETMLGYTQQIQQILGKIREKLPQIHTDYREKLTRKLRENLEAVAPNGFEHIKGEELSARIAAESSLFSLRIDVAEELDRLESHQTELATLLQQESDITQGNIPKTKNKQSLGKRLDFLFQEMNREINTLGSKSTALEITQAIIELKLLVEQLREQAQNIE